MPEGKIYGILKELNIPYTVDFTNADEAAHRYAVKELIAKFGRKGDCTLLDYVKFYAEHLQSSKETTIKEET